MAIWIEEHELLSRTIPGPVGTHAGSYWSEVTSVEPSYEVISQGANDLCSIHHEDVLILGFVTGSYCLTTYP